MTCQTQEDADRLYDYQPTYMWYKVGPLIRHVTRYVVSNLTRDNTNAQSHNNAVRVLVFPSVD